MLKTLQIYKKIATSLAKEKLKKQTMGYKKGLPQNAEGQAKITAKHLINIIMKKRIIGFDLGFTLFVNESIS